MSFLITFLAAMLAFSAVIAIHELGHFLAAKLCGIQVNEFSVGMGPALWHKVYHGTQYSLRALPVGGFVALEGEESPESRGGTTTADDVVTVNFAYFRNKRGGIGRYVWVNDVELEYLEDYQARMLTRCSKCGEVMEGDTCEYCGSKKYERKAEDTFALFEDIERSDGSIIPAYTTEYQLPMEGMQEIIIDPFTGEAMEAIPEEVSVQTKVPYYKPDCYPIVLRRNVSSWGKVLGDSDVSKIQDQQNAIKKCDTRVQEKLDKGGSILIKNESTGTVRQAVKSRKRGKTGRGKYGAGGQSAGRYQRRYGSRGTELPGGAKAVRYHRFLHGQTGQNGYQRYGKTDCRCPVCRKIGKQTHHEKFYVCGLVSGHV